MSGKTDKLKTAAMLGAAFMAGRYSGSASARDDAHKIAEMAAGAKGSLDQMLYQQAEMVRADEAHREKYWWTPRSLFFRFWKFISPF